MLSLPTHLVTYAANSISQMHSLIYVAFNNTVIVIFIIFILINLKTGKVPMKHNLSMEVHVYKLILSAL